MRQITIEDKNTTSSTIFISEDNMLEPIRCAFDKTATCSPNCAACEQDFGSAQIGFPAIHYAKCLRSNVVIGEVKQ